MTTTQPLWRWRELCAACGTEAVDGPDITGISIDSRTLSAGDLFVALSGDPGERFRGAGSIGSVRDGHDFIDQAIAAGAAGILARTGTQARVPVLAVDDTLDGLWRIGQAAGRRTDARIVAITGSAGKTTMRQWLEDVLGQQGRTHASTGSFNNHWGVPLSLARMPASSRYGVFEVGTNHPGEIEPLSRLVSPHVAVLLNVLPAHIGNFPDIDALRAEKLSIAAGVAPEGTLVVSETVELSDLPPCRVIRFGVGEDADVAAKVTFEEGGAAVNARVVDKPVDYRLNVAGEHRVMTSLAVLACVHALAADVDRAASALANVTLPAGRGNVIAAGGASLVDDSYNANPVSMRYALESLAREQGATVAILGEMLELGEQGAALHQGIEPACSGIDGVVTVGEGFADWGDSLGGRHWGHFGSAAEVDVTGLADRISRLSQEGTRATILVKGANKVFWVNGFVARLAAALEERQTRGNR